MPIVSIITCISKPDVYNSCLLKSVKECRRKHDVRVIPIINNDNLYSASNALNIGIEASKGDIVIFAHQDVRLLYDWFDLLLDLIDQMPPDWGVLGTAGINLKYGRHDIGKWGGAATLDTVAVGTVWDSDESLVKPPYWDGTKDLATVHCADECLFMMNKRTGLRFDQAFNGFHFYGVDLCLQARAAAYNVYCAHLPIIHYGKYSASFTGDKKYWVYLRYLYNKWRFRFPEMLGTHMHWAHNELTSYISVGLEDDSGISVGIKAMGIKRARLSIDKKHHFVDEFDD